MFDLFNTNFRDFKTIFSSFTRFKEILGKKRKDWPQINNQEEHKQYVSIMINTKLFYEKKIKNGDNEETYFNLTEKGNFFNTIVNNDFSENEKYFLAFVLTSDANINKEKNYLLEKSKEIFNIILGEKLSEEKIILKLEEVFKIKNFKIKKIYGKRFFLYSFFL